MTGATPVEALARRDRAVVLAGLSAVIALAWAYILAGAGMGMTAVEMTVMSSAPADMAGAVAGMAMEAMTPARWSPGYAALMFFMWWIMMVAMMLPSAAPMILLFAAVGRRQRTQGASGAPAGLFVLGYLVAWGGFSAAATAIQWGLERAGVLSSMLASTSLVLGGAVLVAAGLWQFTPLKRACLRHCRAPLHYLAHHWRKGAWGAIRMGAQHGAFCLGCCWFLMALLFYGGIMNLYWIIGLAVFVLMEKLLPGGERLGKMAGLVLIAWGAALLFGAAGVV